MGGWATPWVEQLKQGKTVQFRPRGYSMRGKIESGELVTCVPVRFPSALKVGDIVLCKVSGNVYLHMIGAVDQAKADGSRRFKIVNAHGHVNGWTGQHNIYGLCTRIEP
jgi:hypothetical protein